jgi:hypothetical protein
VALEVLLWVELLQKRVAVSAGRAVMSVLVEARRPRAEVLQEVLIPHLAAQRPVDGLPGLVVQLGQVEVAMVARSVSEGT